MIKTYLARWAFFSLFLFVPYAITRFKGENAKKGLTYLDMLVFVIAFPCWASAIWIYFVLVGLENLRMFIVEKLDKEVK